MRAAETEPRGGRMRIPRSRGAVSGLLLVLLGLWGALTVPHLDRLCVQDVPDGVSGVLGAESTATRR